MTPTLSPPIACPIAFKEWAGVCDALGMGRQSLILRKGGVSEANGNFRPEHPSFWLYPTIVHEAEQGLRSSPRLQEPGLPDEVFIDTLAVVEWLGRVDRIEQLDALAELHDWTESTVRSRFHYRNPGLWVLAVRVYRKSEPSRVAITPAHLGCKTWVSLESPPTTSGLVPVLDHDQATRQLGRVLAAVGTEAVRFDR